jgi:hypothetical protein
MYPSGINGKDSWQPSNSLKNPYLIMSIATSKDFLGGFIETTKEYKEGDSDEKTRLKKVCVAELMAYGALRNCDQAKYGNLTNGLQEQFSLGTDQYPKAIQNTMDVLTSHRFDAKHSENQKRNRERAKKEHHVGGSCSNNVNDVYDVTRRYTNTISEARTFR